MLEIIYQRLQVWKNFFRFFETVVQFHQGLEWTSVFHVQRYFN